MFIMKGKYNIAKIYLPAEADLEESAKTQIQCFLNHPAFKSEPICIMPDTHFGKGAVIGFTMKMNDYILPNIVGVDLGCGILSYNLGKIETDLPLFDLFIHENIPAGFHINNHKDPADKIQQYLLNFRIGNYSKYGRLDDAIIDTTEKIRPGKVRDFLNSIGTLGGGNHFIELGKDQEGNSWLTVHTGSRNFGLQIANYHQNKAKQLMKKFFIHEDTYKDLEFLPTDQGGDEYLMDASYAQRYAALNREVIIYRIVRGFFKQVYDSNQSIESVHNYINFEDKIIRKGAIQANIGQKVIIPFNMQDGLIIGTSKGNKDWNFSAPHGAGRCLSRSKARELLNLDFAKESMKKANVHTTSLDESTLDETKEAYKDPSMILEMIKETLEVDFFVKPIYNFKAGE